MATLGSGIVANSEDATDAQVRDLNPNPQPTMSQTSHVARILSSLLSLVEGRPDDNSSETGIISQQILQEIIGQSNPCGSLFEMATLFTRVPSAVQTLLNDVLNENVALMDENWQLKTGILQDDCPKLQTIPRLPIEILDRLPTAALNLLVSDLNENRKIYYEIRLLILQHDSPIFHPFSRLPQELRDLVWKLASDEGRII